MSKFAHAAEALVSGDAELAALEALAETSDTRAFLETVLTRSAYAGRTALVTSFGAESAVLLHLVAGIDPRTPVIFFETGKLFPETLAYRNLLAERLGLEDVRSVKPDAAALLAADPAGDLWPRHPAPRCRLRTPPDAIHRITGGMRQSTRRLHRAEKDPKRAGSKLRYADVSFSQRANPCRHASWWLMTSPISAVRFRRS